MGVMLFCVLWCNVIILVTGSCPIQPNEIVKGLAHMKEESMSLNISLPFSEGVCIFQSFDAMTKNNTSFDVDYVVSSVHTVPSAQSWMHCKNCYFSAKLMSQSNGKNQFVGYTSGYEIETPHTSTTIDASSSLWSEFFHYDLSDQYQLVIDPLMCTQLDSPIGTCASSTAQRIVPRFIVTQPVYIIPLITLHVGHVLIDVLEQVL